MIDSAYVFFSGKEKPILLEGHRSAKSLLHAMETVFRN
jgi:hypothetical protein